MKLILKIIRSLTRAATVLCLAVLCSLLLTPWWPRRLWWVANTLLIAPVWIGFIGLALLLILSLVFRDKKLILMNLLSFAILFLFIMGWNIPWRKAQPLPPDAVTVKIMTVNVGEGMDMTRLAGYFDQMQPDVILLQEVYGAKASFLGDRLPERGWEFEARHGLAVASRLPVLDVDYYDSSLLGADLEGPDGPLYVSSVHLETPRKGIEAFFYNGLMGRWNMQGTTDRQEDQSVAARDILKPYTNIIIGGDFNMRLINPIYKDYWSGYQNAFSSAGWGFGKTKYTRWYGARIDHILVPRGWKVVDAAVGPNCGGDHRPVYAEVAWTQAPQPSLSEAAGSSKKKITLPPAADISVYENFESKPVKIPFTGTMEMSLRYDRTEGRSLQIEALPAGAERVLSLPLPQSAQFHRIRFSYQIPQGLPLVLRVKTPFGQWLNIGATPDYQNFKSLEPRSELFYTLINDGRWQEIDMDVIAAVQSRLKAIKSVDELQFLIPDNAPGDIFLLDDFLIGN